MTKHPYSNISSIAITVAFAILAGTGVLAAYAPRFEWLAPIAEVATILVVLSLAAIIVSTTIAGACAAAHAEHLRAAGKWGGAFWAALYAMGCLMIDLVAGHFGIQVINQAPVVIPEGPGTYIAIGFIAFGRFAMSAILQARADLEAAEKRAQDAIEHEQTIERMKVNIADRNAREANGERSRANLRAVGLVGASAALLGASAGEVQAAQVEYPTETIEAPETLDVSSRAASQSDTVLDVENDAAPAPWKKGPKARNRSKFEDALNLVASEPEISIVDLRDRMDIDYHTAKQWRGWAKAIISNPVNANLIEAA